MLFIVYAFIIIALLAFMQKVYLDDKLSDEKRRGNLLVVFNRYFSVTHLFRLSKDGRNKDDLVLVRQANRALIVFYSGFLSAIVLGFINVLPD